MTTPHEAPIPARYQMRFQQLLDTPVLDRVPYFHDEEVAHILEVALLEQNIADARKRAADAEEQVKALSRPVSNEEWQSATLFWDGTDLDYDTEAMEREELDALIAARMSSAGGNDGK